MNIKYVDLSISGNDFDKNYAPLIKECFINGNFVGGEEIVKFEKNFAKFCEVKYAISLNSGTDALILSLMALGIKKGDEVITVANSFIATTNAIKIVGAKPIFVDIGSDMLINTNIIEKEITTKVKAIIPVHLSGQPCEMNKINKLAKKHNLFVIEDAAQSVFSRYKNKVTGNLGDIGCFSLHPLKNLSGIGDGGIVTTNNKKIYDKILKLRNHGMIDRDKQAVIGFNSRLDTINAKILNYRLKNLQLIINKRRENAKYYIKNLQKVNDVVLPLENENCYHTYHTFVIQVKNRDKLMEHLSKNGIETKIHYPIAIIKQKPYKNIKTKLPKTLKACDSILSLPIGGVSKKEINFISTKIKEFYYIK